MVGNGVMQRCGVTVSGGVVHHRGGVIGGRVVGSRGGVIGSRLRVIGSGGWGMIGGGGVVHRLRVVGGGLGVMGHTLVAHISDETVVVISVVLDVLGATVGKQDTVAALDIAGGVGHLGGVEVGSTVLVVDSVLVAVWLGLLFVHWLRMVVGGGWWWRMVVGSGSRMVGGRVVGIGMTVREEGGGGQSGAGKGEETGQYLKLRKKLILNPIHMLRVDALL